ncbi:MAG: cytochrome c biogenesis protein, partial [Actinobacteria bacterium]|nr:cytochrome c biogenesis protein [Actinomycetota bacterium]
MSTSELRGVSLLRYLWRQLTSMRNALILLLLLGIASIPGSLFPQRTASPLKVREYFENNPNS